ncbi:MAG: hypothetical protein IJZ70_07605 [Bacteroidales bacterium]|nr:hypothetical protein [Bacteroidales bacterium]
MKKIIIILSVLALSAACSRMEKDNVPVNEGEAGYIMLRAMTKADGGLPDVDDTPVFLFWLDGDHSKLGTEEVQPYFVSYPQGAVDDYNTTPYNTGYPYPGTMTVYANGYNPSYLIMEEGDGIYSWTKLSVPEGMHGYLDITGTDKFVQGSQSSPFEADNAQTMKFKHLLSKVNFYARLGEIPAERYFKGVKVKVNGNNVFTSSISWIDGKYAASDRVGHDLFWTAADPNTNQMDPNEVDPRKIGSVHIHPGQEQITFDLEVEMSETVTFDSCETIRTTATVGFTDGAGTTLDAGYEYDINITILYDSFVIKGNKAKWQDGGKIPLPFYPN